MRIFLLILFLSASITGVSQNKILERGEINLPGKPNNTNVNANGERYQIRCFSAVSQPEAPLWIIDGELQKSPVKYLDPDIIESIFILKAATAPAIYRCSASRGAIIITTKKRPIPAYRKMQGFSSKPARLSVYPNPLPPGQSLTVKVTGNEIGYLRVISMQGITLLVKEVRDTKMVNILPGPNWLAGAYLIQYLDKNKKALETAPIIIR